MRISVILSIAALFVTTAAMAAPSGWAVVNSNGTLARGTAGTSSSHLNTGVYEVDFPQSVKKCVFTATTGLSGSSGAQVAGFVTVAGRGSNDAGVFVTTYGGTGSPQDLGFHLNVRC